MLEGYIALSENSRDNIKQYMIQKLCPYAIFLYGSAAKGHMKPDSDIDIAFLNDKALSDYDIFMVSQELTDKIKRDVDLIDLSKASAVMKAQVVVAGIMIHNTDALRTSLFQMNALKEYAVLNEQRKCVLDSIREKGFEYGQ
ncbi:MAG TPA: nucleotidyltransferase domain-containing protein [Clostridiaceae bacterium]